MEDIRNAIATAVAKAIREPGNAYQVIEWIPNKYSPSSGLSVVSANNQLPLAPHRVVTPAYRATINSDNSVSVTNT